MLQHRDPTQPNPSQPNHTSAVLGVDTSERAKWSALAMEVANSRGLCAIAEGAQRFNGERKSLTEDEPDKVRLNADLPPATASVAGDSGSSTDRASATSESEESGVQMVGVGGAGDGDVPRRASRGRIRRADTTAEKAAMIIAAGGKAGGLGAHPVQKTYNAVLEGLLWSIAGRGGTDGVSENEDMFVYCGSGGDGGGGGDLRTSTITGNRATLVHDIRQYVYPRTVRCASVQTTKPLSARFHRGGYFAGDVKK